MGSSPRGRGKLIDRLSIGFMSRLIPARAGKTHTISIPTPPITAHPRAGGENKDEPKRPREPNGSSPRGRGKLTLAHAYASNTRLIPARAGKTLTGFPSVMTLAAHPRAGGENRADGERC